MTSTIAIGDIHGLTYWKNIIEKHPDSKVVFLGDYLDPYEELTHKFLLYNLLEIIQLKKKRSNDIILLLGNHDMHYITDEIEQGWRYDYGLSKVAAKIFLLNRNLFQFAYQEDNYVFTHAGIAHKWFVDDFKGDITQNIANQLNNPRPNQTAALYACGRMRGGFDETGGIFWADMEELSEPLQGYTQVVGHNQVEEITEYTNKDARIVFCDCLFNEGYLKI